MPTTAKRKLNAFTFYMDDDNRAWVDSLQNSTRSRAINDAMRAWRQREKVVMLLGYLLQLPVVVGGEAKMAPGEET